MSEQKSTGEQQSYDFSIFLQRFSSKVLWHFTGYKKTEVEAYQILDAILTTKTLELGRENEAVVMNSGERRGGHRVACVCDIPFRDLRIHTLRYGTIGIAFHKKAALEKGHFNPVFYVHRRNPLFDQAHDLVKKLTQWISTLNPVRLLMNISGYLEVTSNLATLMKILRWTCKKILLSRTIFITKENGARYVHGNLLIVQSRQSCCRRNS
jgi:Putative abortive phage resistance protein AbiGi, antitoxin